MTRPATHRKHEILGPSWIVGKDQMSINVSCTVQPDSRLTKRSVLKQIATAFDPLGLFSPVILKGNISFKHYGTRICHGMRHCLQKAVPNEM